MSYERHPGGGAGGYRSTGPGGASGGYPTRKPDAGTQPEDWRKYYDQVYAAAEIATGAHPSYVRRLKQFIEKVERDATDRALERAAHKVETWHISKGGYTELAHQVRKIGTSEL